MANKQIAFQKLSWGTSSRPPSRYFLNVQELKGALLFWLINPDIRPLFGCISCHIETSWPTTLFIPSATIRHITKGKKFQFSATDSTKMTKLYMELLTYSQAHNIMKEPNKKPTKARGKKQNSSCSTCYIMRKWALMRNIKCD